MPNTTNFNWATPADTDLVKDGAAAIRTLGNSIDSSFVDLKGGTTGQILSKASNTDLDYTWIANDVGDITAVTAGTGISGGGTSGAVTITNSMATEITAKGDLIVGTGSGTFDNLPAGTNGYTLVADSSVSPTGLKWAAPSSGALTLISSTTIGTTVSSIAVTNVFSSTYDNYLILITGGVMSASPNFQLQLGSTTTGYYESTYYFGPASGTINPDPGNNVANFRYAGTGSTSGFSGIVYLQGPNIAKPTFYKTDAMRAVSSRTYTFSLGTEDSSTQHTGFTLLVDGGQTASGGTIKVYGYQNQELK